MAIYIKRKKEISLQEWLAYLQADRELVLSEYEEGVHPVTRQRLKMKIAGRALLGNVEVLYKNGYIVCEDHSKKTLLKLTEAADFLEAVLEEE